MRHEISNLRQLKDAMIIADEDDRISINAEDDCNLGAKTRFIFRLQEKKIIFRGKEVIVE